jgi:hypothetical protein
MYSCTIRFRAPRRSKNLVSMRVSGLFGIKYLLPVLSYELLSEVPPLSFISLMSKNFLQKNSKSDIVGTVGGILGSVFGTE